MIGFAKSNLRKALYKKCPTYNEFRTLVAETENVFNQRPLTYISEDCTDEPLTPCHLLYGRLLPMAPQKLI